MILALETLSAGWMAFFFAVAVILFLLAALSGLGRVAPLVVIALGLAFFAFPFFWNNLAAA